MLTIQNKDTTHSTNLLHTGRNDTIYTTLSTQSGPVHLSCSPERRQLSLLLKAEQPVRASKGFPRANFVHVGHSWRLWNIFKYGHLQYLLLSTLWKQRVRPGCCRNRIARPVQNGNWYSRLAQCVCDTELYITGKNITVTYCCGNTALLHIVTGL